MTIRRCQSQSADNVADDVSEVIPEDVHDDVVVSLMDDDGAELNGRCGSMREGSHRTVSDGVIVYC